MYFFRNENMFKFVAVLSVVLALTQAAPEGDNAPVQPPSEDAVYDSYRLPTAITPENYKLDVITHLNDTEGFIFRGSVWITVRTKIDSVLHKNQGAENNLILMLFNIWIIQHSLQLQIYWLSVSTFVNREKVFFDI